MVFVLSVVYQLPPVERRLGWRVDQVATSLRTVLHPVGKMPTAVKQIASTRLPTATRQATITPSAAATQAPSPTAEATAAPTFTPTPVPAAMRLDFATFNDAQDANNCGPATLALYLRFYGWEGDQFTISEQIKPLRADRNVNVDELLNYVYNHTESLSAEFRVGGDLDLLREFVAAGIPVMIEEGFPLDENYWTNDDRWSGHYLLVTGYDDTTETFLTQDSFRGPNKVVVYKDLDKTWKSFNRVYFVLYRPEQEETVRALIGDDWDHDINRQHAMEAAQQETEADPEDAMAWFNLGTNLVYFERYDEAADAYDRARELGLPQRMLRYQFGPFMAYFHAGRNDDLLALTEYALGVTPNSEEALLWRGWALYRAGNSGEAVAMFNQALAARPDYQDAVYAISFVAEN